MDSEAVGNKINRVFKHSHINDNKIVSDIGLTYLIDNFLEAVRAKDIRVIDGMLVYQWEEWFKGRIGKEPLFRLLYVFFKTLSATKVDFYEVMSEEPSFFILCMNENRYMDYHNKYNTEAIGSQTLYKLRK